MDWQDDSLYDNNNNIQLSQSIAMDFVQSLRNSQSSSIAVQAKVVLLGCSGVGKSSIVRRYMFKEFSDSLPSTVGAAFHTKAHACVVSTASLQNNAKKLSAHESPVNNDSQNNLSSSSGSLSSSVSPSLNFFTKNDVLECSEAKNNNAGNSGYLHFMSGHTSNSINVDVTLNLWDTAGQERFRSMGPMYYRGCDIAVFVFDISCEESFRKAKDWVNELKANVEVDNGVTLILVANKSDFVIPSESSSHYSIFKHSTLPNNELFREAKAFSEEIGAKLFVTSAKMGDGIEELFQFVTYDACIKQLNKQVLNFAIAWSNADNNHQSERSDIVRLDDTNKKRSCCF